MLTRLIPEQISRCWDIIKYAIIQTTPPTISRDPGYLNRLLMNMIAGHLDVWILHEKDSDGVTKIIAVGVTRIINDDIEGVRNLLIYSVYGYDTINTNNWAEVIKSISKFAKDKNCGKIITYSIIPYVIERLKGLGWDADYVLISHKL